MNTSFRLLLLLCCVILQSACSGQSKKINGISFVAAPEAISTKDIDPVVKINANYAAIMPFGYIRDLDAADVFYNTDRQWYGETRAGVKQYINELQAHHIKVMVKPQLWVWQGEFTGFIEMKSEADWKKFEAGYEKFILEFAEVAQEAQAEIYCIGTELHKFVAARPAFWKQLIQKVKAIYKGKITYAENWDSYAKVPFWKDIDFIGIDAYFPLSETKTPTLEVLQEAWQPHKMKIKELSVSTNKKILFTEYGYRSMDYTAKEPWDSSRSDAVNLKAQKIALQAIYNEFWNEEWFAGGFLWKWFHNYKEVGGLKNSRFTIQNKPAEAVVRQQYKN